MRECTVEQTKKNVTVPMSHAAGKVFAANA